LTQEQITQQALQSGLLITKHVTATLLSRVGSIQTDTLIAANTKSLAEVNNVSSTSSVAEERLSRCRPTAEAAAEMAV